MEFFEVVKKRHCCRSFDPEKSVKEADIKKIIDAGKMAPSAGGMYPTRFFITKIQEEKEKILNCIPKRMHWAKEASVILVVWSDPKETIEYYKERGKNLYIIQDAAAAAENIFLTTVALGLATCWIGTFEDECLKRALNLKKDQVPYVIMPIGYKS